MQLINNASYKHVSLIFSSAGSDSFPNKFNDILNDQNAKEFYFLKLSNNGENCCFANSVVQMFLRCAISLFSNKHSKCEFKFCQAFCELIKDFESRIDTAKTSRPLRVIACINKTNLQDCYLNNSQQDSFEFFLDLISLSCKEIQQNFEINFLSKNTCINCNNTRDFENVQKSYYISLTRSLKDDEIDFNSLFSPCIHEYQCLKCGFGIQSKATSYSVLGKFLILRISLEDGDHRYETKIKNLNFDNPISLPGITGTFQCKSAIIHYSNGLTGSQKAGHYTCLVRINVDKKFKWLEISDEKSELKLGIPKDLKDVYLIMLEKKIEV